MRALVTGSAGFVGRHLCPKLEAAGYKVFGCDPSLSQGSGNQIGFQQWHHPITMKRHFEWFDEELLRILEERPFFDLVIHLAANIVNVDARLRGGMDMYSDIELDLAMCRWLEKNPPKQCAVLMSSCAVDYPDDPYCIVKRNLESFARTLHKKGVPVIVLRPFSGYGEDQSEEYPFRAILERALRKEDPLTVWGGSQVRDWIHIDDLTDAILFAVKNCPRTATPFEVGTCRGVSLAELANMIAAACGYLPELFCSNKKARSSLRRVSGDAGSRASLLQMWGWSPKINLEDAIGRAVGNAKFDRARETSCPA